MRNLSCILFVFLSINTFAQEFECDNTSVKEAFDLAIRTVDINTRRGILAAGGDYGGEWTRDIAINSWNGVSLLRPQLAEQSLWSVTINKDTIGHQYWDKIIWTIAAYHHYQITGNRNFLGQAYKCSANTMKELEQITFDKESGLFMGPSVFNDGIAAYPEPIYEPLNYSSSVLDHKNSYHIKCLSTNCVYYGAYLALSKMGKTLNANKEVVAAYEQKASNLKASILKNFYDKDKNTFNYLIDHQGKADKSQEGLGISFAVIFGIIDGDKAAQLISNAVVSKFGITSICPDFPRYSSSKPGRHNNIIWPMVNGFYANAALLSESYASFTNELFSLTHLALDADKGDYNFREIYNPYSGKPDGGYQAAGASSPDYHWESCKLQTWSATAYISMVVNGLIGIKTNETTMTFKPYLPIGITHIELKNLAYRNAVLNVLIEGKGNSIKSFTVDGKERKDHSLDSKISGTHTISIKLE
jgi:hypothetical protein